MKGDWGKNMVILGAGESGVGAALLGKQKGYRVFVSDAGQIQAHYQKELEDSAIDFESGRHTTDKILQAHFILKSPGIPDTIPVIKQAIDHDIPVISEIEFAACYSHASIVAITGSNGKTTTTHLTYHIFKKAGFDVAMAGNMGISFARKLLKRDYKIFILELSSFQLDGIKSFKPDVAVLLNITPDHLDRYQNDMIAYTESKFRIALNQNQKDFFIYSADDQQTIDYLNTHKLKARCMAFSMNKNKQADAWLDHENIFIQFNKNIFKMPLKELTLQGKHNVYNTMAAGIVSRIYEIRKDIVRESMQDFKGLPHRLESVATIGNVRFINDSKATNVNSTWYALESADAPVVWIAGGINKGNDYESLKTLVSQKVKAIVCLGLDNRHLHEAFSNRVDLLMNTQSMSEAVRMAFDLAERGDIVLLSPACASFDLFENYEDRGDQFKEQVIQL